MKKKFRLNVVVLYNEGVNANQYRPNILDMMRHIAWLYELEYAISENHPMPSVPDSVDKSPLPGICDIIYFRSTEQTQIEAKDLRMIIGCIFGKSFLWSAGVDVFYQIQKALREYPFPKDYFRPLNYPYVEVYKNGNPESN